MAIKADSGGIILAMRLDTAGPKRSRRILVNYTAFDWWLTQWTDNGVICTIGVDHEGQPSTQEIFTSCGKDLAAEWSKTGPCSIRSDEPSGSSCTGLYVHLAGTSQRQKVIEVDLPAPQVWISLSGCPSGSPAGFCPAIPSLLFTGVEPLPNERILDVLATRAEDMWDCDGNTCLVPLSPTSAEGDEFTFWAESSQGDASQTYTARVRVVPSDARDSRDGRGWFVDVLSTQWHSGQPVACAQVWDSLPPPGGPPEWLFTPDSSAGLASAEPYAFLAGRLIAAGAIDVHDCSSGGLLPEGTPDGCGMEKARPMVNAWQDRFDAQILAAAHKTGIPAVLLKRVFAQESQFWPGTLGEAQEFGLGRITDEGADTTLLWNKPFFDEFCPLVLEASSCVWGYAQLNETHRAMLRGALLLRTKSECSTCDLGVDLSRANSSVEVFAQALLAHCEQIGRMVYNTTHRTPGRVASYEDLWRFTLANYNAGPGCLSTALNRAWLRSPGLDWRRVTDQLPASCAGGINYVDRVTQEK